MPLEHAILGFLAERSRSGYDLKTRAFDGPLSVLWTADQAQIYRTLERLARGKAVKSRIRRQAGRPDRRVYEITPAGLEELAEWAARNHPIPPLRDPFLVQLWFAADTDEERLGAVLTSERDAHQGRLDSLRATAVSLSAEGGASPRTAALRQMALDGAMASERATIDWLDDTIEAVREGLPTAAEHGTTRQRRLFRSS